MPPVQPLSWGDPGNLMDYRAAYRGQWFLGVVDFTSGKVYMVPSDLEPPDVVARNTEMSRSSGMISVSRPQPGVPGGQWQSKDIGGNAGINSPPSGDQGGLRQHGRVVKNYGLSESNCFGFAVIKFDGAHGEFRDRSNSLNSQKEKFGGEEMRQSPSGRSHRMPDSWSGHVKAWLQHEMGASLQDSPMP